MIAMNISKIKTIGAAVLAFSLAGCNFSPILPRASQPEPAPKVATDITAFTTNFNEMDWLPEDIQSLLKYPPLVFHSLNPAVNSEMKMIKSVLDAHFEYRSDMINYGQHKVWRTPYEMKRDKGKFIGDLEDYAILARAMMIKRGIPARLAMLDTMYDGQLLMVAEANGYVIDRLQKDVRPGKYYKIQMLSQMSLTEPWRIHVGI